VLAQLPAEAPVVISRSRPTGIDHDLYTYHRLDLDQDADDLSLPSPCSLLYTIPPPTSGSDDARLAKFLRRLQTPPERIVYLSTSGVYGDRDGGVVYETDEPNPGTARARRRLSAETQLTAWCDEHPTKRIVLRVPGIYGPARLGLDRLSEGKDVLRDEDSGPGNRIHVDDLVACCVAAMTQDVPAGIYNVGDGDHRSSTAFNREVAHQAGLPQPNEISLAEAQERWSEMRLSFVNESRRVDTTKMQEVLGVTPKFTDPEAGIAASLNTD